MRIHKGYRLRSQWCTHLVCLAMFSPKFEEARQSNQSAAWVVMADLLATATRDKAVPGRQPGNQSQDQGLAIFQWNWVFAVVTQGCAMFESILHNLVYLPRFQCGAVLVAFPGCYLAGNIWLPPPY